VTLSGLRAAQRKRERRWTDLPAVRAAGGLAVGLGVTLAVAAAQASAAGQSVPGTLVIASILLAASLIVACGVYFACASMWIGWDQSVPTTMLRVCAVYGLAFAAASLLGLVPLPLLPWLASVAVLVGLLVRVMDIDLQDAIVVAFAVFVIRTIVGIAIALALAGAP
jgi:hypothetical protein